MYRINRGNKSNYAIVFFYGGEPSTITFARFRCATSIHYFTIKEKSCQKTKVMYILKFWLMRIG